jgi:hypothetical protein
MEIAKHLDKIELLSKEFFALEREIASVSSRLSALYEERVIELAPTSYGDTHLHSAAFNALRSDAQNMELEERLAALRIQREEVSIQLERVRFEVFDMIASKAEFFSMAPTLIGQLGPARH